LISRLSILLVLELELVLVLGAAHPSQAAPAVTRVHQKAILTTPTPAIEFEDEDEFEDEFLYLVPQVRGTTRTMFPDPFTIAVQSTMTDSCFLAVRYIFRRP
jgi:hypothetical protein